MVQVIKDNKAQLIEILNRYESDLRKLSDQPEQQQKEILTVLNKYSEEDLLMLYELSSKSDYEVVHQNLVRFWSYKGASENIVIPASMSKQALNTVLMISQNIIDNWPSLTPKKVSRLGRLINDAALIANQ